MLTRHEHEIAQREGWDLFTTETGYAIQRLDDPQFEQCGYREPKFEDDASAFFFVRFWAQRGSPTHAKALKAQVATVAKEMEGA
jgi:hypothetical protein